MFENARKRKPLLLSLHRATGANGRDASSAAFDREELFVCGLRSNPPVGGG